MLKVKSVIQGTCTSYSNEGEGVIHLNKEVIFVKGLIVGEVADVVINYNRNKINYGSIKKLIKINNKVSIISIEIIAPLLKLVNFIVAVFII